MKILLAGGGSGGHVTPLRAISSSLQHKVQSPEITVITDRIFYEQTEFLFKNNQEIKLKKIFSGKYRRYNNKSIWWHITHIPTVAKNIRDIFFIGAGLLQSFHYFLWHKPDVVFCKGGYVCVPVGLMAHLFMVPLVIHDSDTYPGLTNRFLARFAYKIGTGMPTKYYQYPAKKMIYSGIPVSSDLRPFSKSQQAHAKSQLGFSQDKPLLLVTGGGTGAQDLNAIVSDVTPTLLTDGWQVFHLTGKGKSSEVEKARSRIDSAQAAGWVISEFAEMKPLITAADLIISRAGATAMQEFANTRKAVVLVPSPYLTGGHQLKNAHMFAEFGAALVLDQFELEKQPDVLIDTVRELRAHPDKARHAAEALYKNFAKPAAADEIADVILQSAAG